MSDPRLNWEKIETEERVIIPTADGLGIADEVKVKVPASRDPATGEVFLGEDALQILDDVKARHLGLLTREEIRRLRERLKCTQKELCTLLQLGEKTWTRWETGRERPSRSMNLLLSALNEGRIDLPWLAAHRNIQSRTARASVFMRQHVYARSPGCYNVWVGSRELPDPLPGLEARVRALIGPSTWMIMTEGHHLQGGASDQIYEIAGTMGYQRSPSNPPWTRPSASPLPLVARCTQAPLMPRLESPA